MPHSKRKKKFGRTTLGQLVNNEFKADEERDPDFIPHLQGAMKCARKFMIKNHRVMKIEQDDECTILKAFGGFWQYHINTKHKRLYNYRILEPDAAVSIPLADDGFSLFIRKKLDIRSILSSWIKEAMELYLEHQNETHGLVYVRAKNMMHLPEAVTEEKIDTFRLRRRQQMVEHARRIVINTCWGRNCNYAKAIASIGKKLWSFFDPEVIRLTLQIVGPDASSFYYNLIWNNLDEVKKVMQHSPGVLPLWANLMRARVRNGALTSDKEHSFRGFNCPNIIEDARKWLSNAGGPNEKLTPRAWRWLIHLKPRQSLYLSKELIDCTENGMRTLTIDVQEESNARHIDGSVLDRANRVARIKKNKEANIPTYKPLNNVVTILNFLGEIGQYPKMSTLVRTVRALRSDRTHIDHPSLKAAIRAAFQVSNKKPAKSFWSDEISLVVDWIKRGGNEAANNMEIDADFGVFDYGRHTPKYVELLKNQLSSDWKYFMRKQKEWHDEISRKSVNAQQAQYRWKSLIDAYQEDGYDIVPLTDTVMLSEEGQAMHHCVGTYAHNCKMGTSRIFSIRKDGKRQATVEIGYSSIPLEDVAEFPSGVTVNTVDWMDKVTFKENLEIKWRILQARGPCNGDVSALNYLCEGIVKKWIKLCSEMTPRGIIEHVITPSYETYWLTPDKNETTSVSEMIEPEEAIEIRHE